MTEPRKPHFLVASYMAGGMGTIHDNLFSMISDRDDIDASEIPVHLEPVSMGVPWSKEMKFRPSLIPGTIRNSAVTRQGIQKYEKQGIRFDAAYYSQHTIVTFLRSFRKRVPFLLAMDGTPLFYHKYGLWYAHPYFEPESIAARLKHRITKSIYHQAFHLLPLSNLVKQSLMEDYGIPENRITVVPPPIDLRSWICPERTPASQANRPVNVLFVGTEFSRKGGDLLVEVATSEEFKDVHFHFVTRNYEGPESENIHVYADLQSNTEPLLNLYRTADIFIQPTRADTHSVAALEAMAMGLPVLATNVGGIADIIVEGETGYFIQMDDVQNMSERLRDLVKDPELRLRMGQSGRSRVEEHFNLQHISDKIVDLLKDASASRR